MREFVTERRGGVAVERVRERRGEGGGGERERERDFDSERGILTGREGGRVGGGEGERDFEGERGGGKRERETEKERFYLERVSMTGAIEGLGRGLKADLRG